MAKWDVERYYGGRYGDREGWAVTEDGQTIWYTTSEVLTAEQVLQAIAACMNHAAPQEAEDGR